MLNLYAIDFHIFSIGIVFKRKYTDRGPPIYYHIYLYKYFSTIGSYYVFFLCKEKIAFALYFLTKAKLSSLTNVISIYFQINFVNLELYFLFTIAL